MDRLEKAKLHKAIDSVLEDHNPGMRATRVMIRELILDAIEGAGFGFVGIPAHGETVVAEAEVRRVLPLTADHAEAIIAAKRSRPFPPYSPYGFDESGNPFTEPQVAKPHPLDYGRNYIARPGRD